MSRWLPEEEEEAAQLCFEFAKELERIETLLAASSGSRLQNRINRADGPIPPSPLPATAP